MGDSVSHRAMKEQAVLDEFDGRHVKELRNTMLFIMSLFVINLK